MSIGAIVTGLVVLGLLWSTRRSLRDRRFTARGGTVVTRQRHPLWFWASVALRLALAASLIAYLSSRLATGPGGS